MATWYHPPPDVPDSYLSEHKRSPGAAFLALLQATAYARHLHLPAQRDILERKGMCIHAGMNERTPL
ncbi:MAG TPA: hypothetical protein VGF67_17045 [Ktedonobacteraceae bacterium]